MKPILEACYSSADVTVPSKRRCDVSFEDGSVETYYKEEEFDAVNEQIELQLRALNETK